MYIIINKTTKQTFSCKDSFPNMEDALNREERIIIISLYSNTIKIPYLEAVAYGENIWGWEEYNFNPNHIFRLSE